MNMSSKDEDFYVPDTEERTEVQEYLVIQEIQGNQDTLDVQDEKENLSALDSQEEKEAAIKNTLKELLIYTFFLVIISTGNREHFILKTVIIWPFYSYSIYSHPSGVLKGTGSRKRIQIYLTKMYKNNSGSN
jgi:hypothetical protein